MIKTGVLVGYLMVTSRARRDWTTQEVSLVRDVAERTWDAVARGRTETGLCDSDYRSLVQAIAGATWETDAQGVVVNDSASWRAFTGQTLAELLCHGWLSAVHPDDRSVAEQQWRDAVATASEVNCGFRLRNRSGGYTWTNLRAAPVRTAEGVIVRWLGMNIDITDRKRAELFRSTTNGDPAQPAACIGRRDAGELVGSEDAEAHQG